MDNNNTSGYDNHGRPTGFMAPPPPPTKKPVPVWAWGIGVLLLGLIVVLIVVISGGDKEPEATPAPAVTVTATATPEPTKEPTREAQPEPTEASTQDREPVVLSEGQFLAFLRDTFPYLTDVADEEIMDISNQTCDLFDDGKTPEEVIVKISGKAETPKEAESLGGIVGASVSNYCPEYYAEVEQFLDEAGVLPAEETQKP